MCEYDSQGGEGADRVGRTAVIQSRQGRPLVRQEIPAWLAKAREQRKNPCRVGVHSENRLSLFSLLELSPSLEGRPHV